MRVPSILKKCFHFVRQPFIDVYSKKPSQGTNFDTLDGLRGLAVLIVLSGHTNTFSNANRGFVGVIVFFVLSGFLLSLPFNKEKAVVPNREFLGKYLLRRFKRIYPLYILFIFLNFYPFEGVIRDYVSFSSAYERFKFFLGYAFFVISGGHFWTIVEEVYFYLLLPLIFVVNHYILKEKKFLIFLWMAVASVLWACYRDYLPHVRFNLEFTEKKVALCFDAFFLGVATCYLAFILARVKVYSSLPVRTVTSFMGLFFAVFVFFGSDQNIARYIRPLPYGHTYVWFLNVLATPYGLAIGSAVTILSLLNTRGGILRWIFSSVFLRITGVVGYSMYLVHPQVLAFCRLHGIPLGESDIVRFSAALLLCFLVSCFTYTYIEKPFMENVITMKSVRDWICSAKARVQEFFSQEGLPVNSREK